MAQYFAVHPTHPQPRLIRQAAQIVRRGGLIAYPTDSCYALGCHLGDAQAQQRLRRVRGVDDKHHLTLMCRDLSEIGSYAVIDKAQFRLLKLATPGAFTFILRATREVPRPRARGWLLVKAFLHKCCEGNWSLGQFGWLRMHVLVPEVLRKRPTEW